MLLVFLLLVAVGGTGAVVFYAMDEPRKRAVAQLARLRRERADLDEEADRLEAEAARLKALQTTLTAAAAANARATAAFDRRVITVDDLLAENRILKTDLKNVAVQLAHLDCVAAAATAAAHTTAGQRDRLGRDYFDAVRAAVGRGLTPANYPASKHRLQAAGDRVRADGGDLRPAEVADAVRDLHAQYEKAVRAAAEREHQARLREQVRDEVRREREAQEAIDRAERERAAVAAALERALAAAAGTHAAEVDRLRAQLAEAEARSARAVSNAQLTKRGTVYVISNPGSFGRDVFKIGMTRRDEWMDRVIELGDASVPFPFDVHLAVSCDDAPRLEAALHRAFHHRRVNKVNPRKEFFRVPVEEIVAAVRREHGEVDYVADAEALEWVQSQSMTAADLAEVEEAFAAADAAAAGGD